MRIDKVAIDRFGRRTHVVLDGLSDQLNVIFGPNGSGKSTIVQFIKWALFGNADEVGATYARETSGHAAGSLGFSQDGRRRTIDRRDDGSRHGQWSVDGHLQSDRIGATNLMGSLSADDFDLFFAPSFETEPDLTSLLHAANSRGLELSTCRQPTHRIQELRLRIDNLRREMERLPWIGQELAHLVDHRSSLERRLVQYEDDYRRRRSSVDREYDELNRQVVDLESTIARLREQWHAKDRDVNARRSDLEDAWRTAEDARREFIQRLRGDLSDLENNLDRARATLSEFQRRSSRLDSDLRDRHFDASGQQFDKEETLCMVQSLAKQLDDLRSVPDVPLDAPLYRAQYGSIPTVRAHSSAFEALRGEVGRLCQLLQTDRDEEKVRAMAGEQIQLRQCESEIERWIAKLVEQRTAIAKELDGAERFGVSLVVDDYVRDVRADYGDYLPEVASHPRRVRAVLHACDGFEPIEPDADELLRRLTSDRDLVTRDLDMAERQLRQLLDRRRELELSMHRVQDHETASLRREMAEIDTKIRNAEERERLRREMERLELELNRVDDDIVPSQIVGHAADFLSQLSGGKYVALHVNRGPISDGRGVLVEEASGEMIPHPQLSRGLRDQVYLSLCLAMASALRRQGIEMPLILNDPFINIDSERDNAMANVLGSFAHNGHQVILFTRHRHVTELFQPHQARYIELAPTTQPRPVSRPLIDEVRFRSYPDEPRLVQSRVEPPRIDERGSVSFRRHPEKNVSQYRPLPKRTSVTSGYPPDENRSTEFSELPRSIRHHREANRDLTLSGNVPLHQTGTVDPSAARQLAELGITTVDHLLRSSPDYVEREAQRRGMPGVRPMQRWRDELSLRCLIPRLNDRDARWLVSSGLTTVRALADASIDTLLNRLNSRSGSNYDVPRDVVDGWVRAARDISADLYRKSFANGTGSADPSYRYDTTERNFNDASYPRQTSANTSRRPYAWENYADESRRSPRDAPRRDNQYGNVPPNEVGFGAGSDFRDEYDDQPISEYPHEAVNRHLDTASYGRGQSNSLGRSVGRSSQSGANGNSDDSDEVHERGPSVINSRPSSRPRLRRPSHASVTRGGNGPAPHP